MKALIISDSHGLKEELFEVLNQYEHEVDIIIHCGDSELPKEAFTAYENLIIVGGNCDYDKEYEEEVVQEVKGIKLFVTHGHLLNVKMSAVKLSYKADEVGARLACFGHSHLAVAFEENGVLYVNPGSFRLPRGRIDRSFAIADVSQKSAIVTYYDHLGKKLDDLKGSFQLK